MMPDPTDLFVAWQDIAGRGIYPVARLRVEAEPRLYEFRYIRGALQAQEHGFIAFDSFPALGETYVSDELFPFFKNRIMPPNRPDYAGYVTELGLSVDAAEPIELLARSGGLRATDRLEIYAAPRSDADACNWNFFVRGVRHLSPTTEARIAKLAAQEPLFVMRDVQNQHNPNALLLRTEDKINLGYIPELLVDDLAELDITPDTFKVTVAKVNPPPSPIQHHISCNLRASWPAGRRPFASERFEPIGPEQGH
jgi:hypothetical protein